MEVSPDSTTQTINMYDYINNFMMTPSVFIIVFIVIVAYVFLFMYLGKGEESASPASNSLASTMNSIGLGSLTEGKSSSSASASGSDDSGSTKIFGIIMIGLLIVLVLINGLQYFFGVNIIASVKNLFQGQPEIDITVDQTKLGGEGSGSGSGGYSVRKQVFNVPGNEYRYSDAKAICQAYGGRLATYSELEKAYDNGAEWCNYGWSDGQMALFPTQQKTYDNLQKIEGHEHDCGRPGINGGYMANPHLKFGVNCYGYKPKITDEEEDLMKSSTPYPKSKKDIAMENRIEYWKTKLNEILVSPFNYDSWNKV